MFVHFINAEKENPNPKNPYWRWTIDTKINTVYIESIEYGQDHIIITTLKNRYRIQKDKNTEAIQKLEKLLDGEMIEKI